MATRKKSNESSRWTTKNSRRHAGKTMFSSSSSSDEMEITFIEHLRRNRTETDQQTVGQDGSHLQENPFSFKHFLRKNDTSKSYQNTGARPKVYTKSTTSPNCIEKDTNVYSRNPTELPDFVQDHLVIEQCFLNHEATQQAMPDIDNLPDFALNNVEQRQPRIRNESKKCQSEVLRGLPVDLTGTLEKGLPHRNNSTSSTISSSRLDLPAFNGPIVEPERLEPAGFPFDLPLPLAEPDPNVNIITRDCPPASESSGVPKSLPDFLNDGPIHNRTTLSTDNGSNPNTAESTERRLLLENERLRQELDIARRQLNERTNRIQQLESELASRREVEHEETAHLEKAMEQVEDNLKRSTRRAVNAESTVTSLKKEIETLTTEVSLLRLENRELRCGMGRSECSGSSSTVDKTVRRLACDLRTAASTAELSLRQLMSGVDNLRVLASALENVDRIEDRTKDFLHNFDEENAAGPAL